MRDAINGLGQGRAMSEQAMRALYELRENCQLCDAVVRLDDGTSYNVHRAILSACSLYFRALFTTTLHGTEVKDVRLSGISSEIMNQLISYAYLRHINVTEDNVHSLLITADYLSILGILKICCDYLKSMLTPQNCISIMQFAKSHFCQDLSRDAEIYLLRNFNDVSVKSDEILLLSLEDFKAIVSHDDLNVKSEETVWEAILRWIDYDAEKRKPHIVTLMQTIRLGLLDTQFFLEHVKDHPYVTSCEESRPLIIETLKFLYDLEMITHRDGEVAL